MGNQMHSRQDPCSHLLLLRLLLEARHAAARHAAAEDASQAAAGLPGAEAGPSTPDRGTDDPPGSFDALYG